MKKILLIIVIVFGIVACTGTQVPNQKSNLTVGMVKSKIIEGKTTQTEILELFGSPNLITTSTTGDEVWTYNKSSYNSQDTSAGIGVGGIASATLVGLFGGSTNTVIKSSTTSSIDVIITFDKNNVVKKYKLISSSF